MVHWRKLECEGKKRIFYRAAVLEETPLGLFPEVLYTNTSREVRKKTLFLNL